MPERARAQRYPYGMRRGLVGLWYLAAIEDLIEALRAYLADPSRGDAALRAALARTEHPPQEADADG